LNEEERELFSFCIEESLTCKMSASSYLEACLIIESKFGYEGIRDLTYLIEIAEIEIVSFDLEQANIARLAYQKYGKGRHKAALNFGDCFACALAKITDEPLLFKGNDFSKTDIQSAQTKS